MTQDRELAELQELFQKKLDKIERERDIPAVTGRADGTLFYPGQANRIYVRRTDTRQEVVVWAVNVSAVDLDVILRYDRSGELYVVRPNTPAATPKFQQNVAVAGSAPINPQSSPVLVDAGHIVPGGGFAAKEGGLKVRIPAFRHHGGVWTGEDTITLTPTATASKKSYVMFGVNRLTNASTTALTTDRALGFPLLPSECDSVIAANPHIWWAGAAELANGATTIDAAKIINLSAWRDPTMVGADGSSAGLAGDVPTPAATDNVKFLRGDGTWVTPSTSALPAFGAGATKTLSSDVATAGSDRHLIIAAQTGTADDLIEVSGLNVGDEVVVRADSGDTITVKHNSGSATDKIILYNGVDIALTGDQTLKLVKIASGKVVDYVDKNTGGVSLTSASALLGADVTMTSANTYYDGAAVSLTSGTWLVHAGILMSDANEQVRFTAKLWDGTNVKASAEYVQLDTGFPAPMSLSGIFVLGSTTTVKISGASNGTNGTILKAAPDNGAGDNAGWIYAVQIA